MCLTIEQRFEYMALKSFSEALKHYREALGPLGAWMLPNGSFIHLVQVRICASPSAESVLASTASYVCFLSVTI